MQEGARGEDEQHLIALAPDPHLVQRLHRRLGLALQVAEGGEIVVADQDLRGLVHRLGVQGLSEMPDPPLVQGRGAATSEDAVEVAPAGGGKAGVKAGLGKAGLEDRDRLWD